MRKVNNKMTLRTGFFYPHFGPCLFFCCIHFSLFFSCFSRACFQQAEGKGRGRTRSGGFKVNVPLDESNIFQDTDLIEGSRLLNNPICAVVHSPSRSVVYILPCCTSTHIGSSICIGMGHMFIILYTKLGVYQKKREEKKKKKKKRYLKRDREEQRPMGGFPLVGRAVLERLNIPWVTRSYQILPTL